MALAKLSKHLGICQTIAVSSRGRPPLRSNETILDAALASFASIGYAATSVRALNAQFGLSHETITQRFGSKAELLRAAVGHGVRQFVAELDAEVAAAMPTTDLEMLRAIVHGFVTAASHHPNLGQLLHRSELSDSDRMHLATEAGLSGRIVELSALLGRLRDAAVIRKTTVRELWFLMESAVAPIHHGGLAAMFDPVDGPFDPVGHLERSVNTIMSALAPGRSGSA